jgi:hypothetical protein
MWSRILLSFIKPYNLLREPVSGFYSEPDEISSDLYILFLIRLIAALAKRIPCFPRIMRWFIGWFSKLSNSDVNYAFRETCVILLPTVLPAWLKHSSHEVLYRV